jgi:hypothetical protein
MLGGDIGALAGIGCDVVEFFPFDESPLPGDDGIGPFFRRLGVLTLL